LVKPIQATPADIRVCQNSQLLPLVISTIAFPASVRPVRKHRGLNRFREIARQKNFYDTFKRLRISMRKSETPKQLAFSNIANRQTTGADLTVHRLCQDKANHEHPGPLPPNKSLYDNR